MRSGLDAAQAESSQGRGASQHFRHRLRTKVLWPPNRKRSEWEAVGVGGGGIPDINRRAT